MTVADKSEARVVCPYCVQWRCAECGSDEWPLCNDDHDATEPYWPDGSVAVLTQNEPCERCEQSIADYMAQSEGL